jgi:hypothetical protein
MSLGLAFKNHFFSERYFLYFCPFLYAGMIQKLNNFLDRFNFRIINFILILIIYFLLEYSYKVFVSDVYHIFFYEFDQKKYVFAKLIFIFLFFLANRIRTPFTYFSAMFFIVMMLIPNLILYQFMNFNFNIILHISFFILLLIIAGQIRLRQAYGIKMTAKNQALLLFGISFLMLIPYFLTYRWNVNFSVFSLDRNLYIQRAEANDLAGGYIRYTMGWLVKIILPALLLLGFKKNRKIAYWAALLFLLYLFVTMSHKVILFAPIVAVMLYIIKKPKPQVGTLFTGIIFIILISRLTTEYYEYLNIEATFVRRVFFIPAILNESYFDFFAGKPIFFGNSFLSGLFDYPYALPPSNLIASIYWGKPHVSANNGFLSNGYMHIGHLGSILFSIIVAGIIKLIDSLKVSSQYNGIFLITLFTFISSALFTSLLTHGVFLLIIFSYIFLHNTQNEQES